VSNLSDGYNTVIGEKGVGLSGGQKQRISIARALLKNAPILIFDDCTSALDLETERQILQDIKFYYPQKTIIMSSHRAGSLTDCDQILFFDNGQIIERGTHQELLDLKGEYCNIYLSQEAARIEYQSEYIIKD